MRRWQCWLRLVLAAAAGILAGCRTPPSPAGDATADIPARLSLPRESAAFAEALAYFSQGLIYEYHDEYGAALTNYQRAVALDPENEELHLRLAMGLLQQKRGAEAVAVMDRFVARRPQSRKGLLWLALLYRATNQPEQTERVYERLVQHAPAEPAGYIELAAIYAGRNETEKAVQILERGLSQTANSNDILRALAALHVRAAISGGAREKEARARQAAIKTLEQILQSAPRDVAILYQLGDMYILDQQIEKAVACFEQIEKQHPDNLQIKQKLALSFIAVGDREKAVRVLEQVARRDPGNPRVF